MDEDDYDFFVEPLGEPWPAWLLEPLTSGTFSNGFSKVGYLPLEAWAMEGAIRASRLNGVES